MAYNSVSRVYDSSAPQNKQNLRKVISTMTELDADFNDSLSKVMEVINTPQFDSILRSNPQLKTKVDAWQNELINSIVHFRERSAFMLQDLKYIASPVQLDPVIKTRLDQACDSMNPISSSDISSKIPIQQLESMIADKLNVLYPGYKYQRPGGQTTPPLSRSQTPPITTRNAVYDQPPVMKDQAQAYRIDQHGNKVFMDLSGYGNPQNRSPRPSEISRASATPSSPMNSSKIYIIDPVTGERIERRDTVIPSQSTVYPTVAQVKLCLPRPKYLFLYNLSQHLISTERSE